MPTYDHPFVKRLKPNDVGIRTNQGGPYIPVSLREFFPPLPRLGAGPTVESFVHLELFDGQTPIGSGVGRWHVQTWHGTRSPEARLTRAIARLTTKAKAGDYLQFERQVNAIDRYRVTLVRSGTQPHRQIQHILQAANWGPIGDRPGPVRREVASETHSIEQLSKQPFQMFQSRTRASATRVYRDGAFARLVRHAYDTRCAACGEGYVLPVDHPDHSPPCEPEAAHIVPVTMGGSDHLQNGLCLCRAHHWAFDAGIAFVDSADVWRVVDASKKENRNSTLNDIDGTKLRMPTDPALRPHPDALEWHRENWVLTA